MIIRGMKMPKYSVLFNVSELLRKIVPDAYCEIIGLNILEVTITTSKSLTSKDISDIEKKLPFVEITKTEG